VGGRWTFERGDKVRILEGPYRGFEGVIDEAASAEGRLHVFIPVYGSHTRLELAYGQVRPL
jgi:transcription termination/antitermination protein NusG